MLSFTFSVILTSKEIVQEKESGIKEAMKLMGMSSPIYWLSWYIKSFILLIPSLILMVISYNVRLPLRSGGYAAIINKTDPFLFTIFLLLYSSSLSTFTLVCSTLFKKSSSATAGTGIIYFMTYLPNLLISLRYDQTGFVIKMLAALVNNLAMAMGVQIIGMFEGAGRGLKFSNFYKGISFEDHFSMAHILFIMFLNNFLHIFLLYYFDNVLPGDHGIAKPWNFIFKNLYGNKRNKESTINNGNNIEMETKALIENESIYSSKKIGIKIMNLFKVFKQLSQKKRAVDNLSLNIYEGQITVLLGHNGAGKRYIYIDIYISISIILIK